MVEPADEADVRRYVAQNLAAAWMAPVGVTLFLVNAVPCERLVDLFKLARSITQEPSTEAEAFIAAAIRYFEPGEQFLASELVHRRVSRPALDRVVDNVCSRARDGKGKVHAIAAFLRHNVGFTFNGYWIEKCGPSNDEGSRNSTLWTIAEARED